MSEMNAKITINCPKGIAGGLYDLSAHEVNTRVVEGTGLKPGMGVVLGTTKGSDVKLPIQSSTAEDFEGLILHNSVMLERGMDGKVVLAPKKTIGVLTKGKAWVMRAEKATPKYKDDVYLITDGAECGCFTTTADSSNTHKVKLDAIFLGEVDDGLANVEFR